MQHESNLQTVSIGHRLLTRSMPGQHKRQLVEPWMLSEREITDWSGLRKLLWGFIVRFSLRKTRSGKFSVWIDCSGSWKSFEERTSAAQAKQSYHFSFCLICVPIYFLHFPIWDPLYGLQKSVVLALFNFENVTEFDKKTHTSFWRSNKWTELLGTDTCSWTLKELIALECPKSGINSVGFGCLTLIVISQNYVFWDRWPEHPLTVIGAWWKF